MSTYFPNRIQEAMMIDGPANGTLVAIPGDMNTWDVLVTDAMRRSVMARDMDPYGPSFHRATYNRIRLSTYNGFTPSGFSIFVWDGRRQ